MDDLIPAPTDFSDPITRESAIKALKYMDLTPGQKLSDLHVSHVFIGSCTNARLADLRSAAKILMNNKISPEVTAICTPGSADVKKKAEQEGIDKIFKDAGADWREPGCSMCLGMNGDIGLPGELIVSTSNRNFMGRQGPGVRTILVSPETAASTAIAGVVEDPRNLKKIK